MSPSASLPAIVAVRVSFVFGVPWSIVTDEMLGAEFATVTAAEVSAAPLEVPSLAVTATVIASPLSPLPACERSSVAPVAPVIGVPFLRHWWA